MPKLSNFSRLLIAIISCANSFAWGYTAKELKELETHHLTGLILRAVEQKNICRYELIAPGATNTMLWAYTVTNPIVEVPNDPTLRWCRSVASVKNELGTLALLETSESTVTILQFDKNNKPLTVLEDIFDHGWLTREGRAYSIAVQPPDKIIISREKRPIFITVVKDGKIFVPEGQDTGGSGGGGIVGNGGKFIGSGTNTPAIKAATNSIGESPRQTNAGGLNRLQ